MEGKDAPADGVVTGYGKVDGRLVAVCAYDFTVMAGSMGMTGELKVTRLRELALQKRIPFIWLLDSAGARIQEAAGSLFAGSGYLFREEVVMSGVIPQIAALMGPCAAGTAYIPGLADFVPMVKGRGSMALAGPHLVEGGHRRGRHPGGARRLEGPHRRSRASATSRSASDEECIQAIKDYLSLLPAELRAGAADPPDAPTRSTAWTRSCSTCCRESNRKPYDMYEVIRRIVDDGDYFDIKPRFARTIITCLARMGGRPVGIVANQPKQLGGILENDSADKAARFINLCDAYGIPLLFLQDVPGFMVGTKVEQAGIIRHGAKMLYAVSRATVPKITVVVRKAYGAGYYVMCGKAYEPDLIVAWPSAEISVMGAEGAVNIIFRKQIEAAEDPDATRKRDGGRDPRDDRPLHRRRQRADRRRHRPARDAPDRDPRARDGGDQEGRAAVEEARGDAGMRAVQVASCRARTASASSTSTSRRPRREPAGRCQGGRDLLPRAAAVARALPDQAGPAVHLGSEIAGVVRDAPEGSGFAAGRSRRRVHDGRASPRLAAAPPHMTFALPDELSFEQGAGARPQLPHRPLLRCCSRGQLKEGEIAARPRRRRRRSAPRRSRSARRSGARVDRGGVERARRSGSRARPAPRRWSRSERRLAGEAAKELSPDGAT